MINSSNNNYEMDVIQSTNPIDRESDGLYTEIQINNYLNEIIYITDVNNTRVYIPPSERIKSFIEKKSSFVEIQLRVVKGKRKFTDSYNGNEIWKGPLYTIRIPHDKLLENVVYVKEIDAVLSTKFNLEKAIHPHSEGVYELGLARLYTYLKESSHKPSVMFVANDSTGNISNLYCIINGETVSIHVDNNQYEKSIFKIIYRNTMTETGFRTVEYDFDEIVGSGGCFILKDKTPFFIHEDITVVKHKYNQWMRKEATKLDIQAQEVQIKELTKQYEDKVRDLETKIKTQELRFKESQIKDKDTIRELEQRCSQYKIQLDQLIEITKLENTRKKLEFETKKYELEQISERERLKFQTSDNIFGLSTNMIKLLVVAIPAVGGLVGWVLKEKFSKNNK